MTEPIAVDVAVKPAPSSKPTSAAKATESEKPPATPAAPASTPSAGLLGDWLTKKQAVIAASALVSMVAGVAAVKLLWPAGDESAPAQALAADGKSGPALLKPPTVETIPSPGLPVDTAGPESPLAPIAPAAPPGAARTLPTANPDLPMPAPLLPTPTIPVAPAGGSPVPPLPSLPSGGSTPDTFRSATVPPVAPLAPVSPLVVPAGGQSPPKPPEMGLPPLPTPPVTGPGALPPLPTPGGMTPAASPPAAPGTTVPLPSLPGGGSTTVPPPIDLAPKTTPPPPIDLAPKTTPPPPIDLAPKTTPPEPMNLAIPPAPKTGAVQGSPVDPPPLTPPVSPPGGGQVGSLPIPPVGPGAGAGSIPAPAAHTGVGGAKLEFTKPPSSPTVTPVGGTDRTATTSYDVDIYEPKAGDTYESISREFYSDTRYANALRAYNSNKQLQGLRSVDVPPIHIVKRFTQSQPATPTVRPTSGTGTPPPEWGPPSTTPPTPRAERGTTFRVPQGGMTMRAVARWALGNEQRWTDIYDLNPQFTKPDERLPAGTELKLPADARPPG